MVDGGEPGVDSRDEGKHAGRNDLLFVKVSLVVAFCSAAPIHGQLLA